MTFLYVVDIIELDLFLFVAKVEVNFERLAKIAI